MTSQRLNFPHHKRQCRSNHFDWDYSARTQHLDRLALVSNDHKLFRHSGHKFFHHMGTAAAYVAIAAVLQVAAERIAPMLRGTRAAQD